MGPQDRSGGERTDFAVETRFHGIGFSGVWHDAHDLLCLQDLAHTHRNCALRYICECCEPTFPKLLAPASFIQLDHQIRLFGFKICGRIVEREMPIFTDPDERYINGRREHCRTGVSNDSRLLNQELLQEPAETGGM